MICMKSMHFKALPIGHQNEQISRDFLLDIKRDTVCEKYQFFQPKAIPFSPSLWKITYFHQINRLPWKPTFSIDFLLDFKGAFPFTMTITKIMDFKENDLFQENELNEHISVKLQTSRKLKNYQILANFQKTAFYRLGVLIWKIVYFYQITRFQCF